jgi:hypothetical protein
LTILALQRVSMYIDDSFRPRKPRPAVGVFVHARLGSVWEDSVLTDRTGRATFLKVPSGVLEVWSEAGDVKSGENPRSLRVAPGHASTDTLRLTKWTYGLYR